MNLEGKQAFRCRDEAIGITPKFYKAKPEYRYLLSVRESVGVRVLVSNV